MIIQRLLLVSAVCIGLFGTCVADSHAQTAPATRGTAKVRPRFFNPFVTGPSRLTLNPFGIFSVGQPTSLSVPAAVASTVVASSEAAAADESGETLAGGSAVRPPFRPRVRSPFRPPPRPPF